VLSRERDCFPPLPQPSKTSIDNSQYTVDCFLGSLCYIRTVFRLNCLIAQLSYEGRAAVEGAK
jgi:hypothetical protein